MVILLLRHLRCRCDGAATMSGTGPSMAAGRRTYAERKGNARSTVGSSHVFTSRDSPRTICRVMMAKWVCMTHLKANWNR